MDDIYSRIQVLLMRKDKECGMLKFLTSRSTAENAAHISEICESIKEIVKSSGIETGKASFKSNKDCVQCFKYLLMNTFFRVQEHLCEDIVNGHLVDMCPPLSPYLLLETVFHLGYEEILAESLLHMPLDLCIEVLEIARRYVDQLEFKRAIDTLTQLVINSYKKLVLMMQNGSQTEDPIENVDRFTASVQELIALLTDSKVTDAGELEGLKIYERHGLILQKVLRMARNCFDSVTIKAEDTADFEKMYRVTFGRDYIVTFDSTTLEESLAVFNKELVGLLLGHVKKIDCNTYLGWAELDDSSNSSVSLQRAVGFDCYYCIESIRKNEKLSEYEHLVECLKQLSSKPEEKIKPSAMSLEMLYDSVGKGDKECLEELIGRYQEWDTEVLSCLGKNYALMDKTSCLILLENGIQLLAQPDQNEFHKLVYATVMRAPLFQSLIGNYEIAVELILKHDANNVLESANFNSDFRNFLNQNMTLCSNKESLRTTLFFIVQNPKKVLPSLLKIAIGIPQYNNAMILPEDLCKLSPILQIQDANELSLLTNALRDVCNENLPWNPKKLTDLVQVFLERDILFADDLINNIFIPYLQNESRRISNLQSILNCLRIVKNRCTMKMNVDVLLKVLARNLTELRKDLSKYQNEEAMNSLIRMIEYFVNEESNCLDAVRKEWLINEIELFLEPMDKVYFASLWFSTRNGFRIDQVIQDYEKRCLLVSKKFRDANNTGTDLDNSMKQYGLDTKDFLHHLILRCTGAEYMSFALDAIIFHWDYFGWTSEIKAYEEFALATIDVCKYCLEFQDANSNSLETFASLIKSLARMSAWFISIDSITDYEEVQKSLIRSIKCLEDGPDDPLFDTLETEQDSLDTNYTFQTVTRLIQNMEKFGDSCIRNCCHSRNKRPASLESNKFHIKNCFISSCILSPLQESDTLLSNMDRKIYPSYHEDNWRQYRVLKEDSDEENLLFQVQSE